MTTWFRGVRGRDPKDWTVQEALASVADKRLKRQLQDVNKKKQKRKRQLKSARHASQKALEAANTIEVEVRPAPCMLEAKRLYLASQELRRKRIYELLTTPVHKCRHSKSSCGLPSKQKVRSKPNTSCKRASKKLGAAVISETPKRNAVSLSLENRKKRTGAVTAGCSSMITRKKKTNRTVRSADRQDRRLSAH